MLTIKPTTEADRERAVVRIATLCDALRHRKSLSKIERACYANAIEGELLLLGWTGEIEFPQVLSETSQGAPPWLT